MSITPDEISRVKRFESNITHLYLDTTGHVTIGYGHLLANINNTVALPFVHKSDGAAANTVEKQTEWTTIKSKHFGQPYPATYYDQFCTLILNQPDIDTLLTNDLAVFEHQLGSLFPNYPKFPQSAKAGLVDMIFNLGMGTLRSVFTNFVAAVNRQDWATAANQCNRPQVSPQRNTEVKQLFLQAIAPPKPTPTHPSPTPTPTPGTGSMRHVLDIANWPTVGSEDQYTPPISAQQPVSAPATAATLPNYILRNGLGSQSIVAIVAISSNVTTAAITAITAIACGNKK